MTIPGNKDTKGGQVVSQNHDGILQLIRTISNEASRVHKQRGSLSSYKYLFTQIGLVGKAMGSINYIVVKELVVGFT
jgi:hypothetical protein